MVNWPVHVAGGLNVVLIAKKLLDAEVDTMPALRNGSKQFRLSKYAFKSQPAERDIVKEGKRDMPAARSNA